MGKNLVTEAERYLTSWHKDKRRSQVLRIVGVLVVFATIYALILPAVTMSNEVECGMVEHIHTESCWEEQLVWPQPQLVCAVESSGALVLHTHDSYCYNEQGELICTLPEVEAHVHGPECYQEQRTLICGQVADPGHQHTASCYTYIRVESTDVVSASGYTCGLQEGEGAHIHTEECYPMERAAEPLCGLEETGDEYDEQGNLIRQGHTHTEECWMVRVHEKLICGQEETEDEYDEEGNLIRAGHHHTSSCWLTGDELCYQYGCGQLESTGHVHTAACGQGSVQTDAQGELWEQVLICGEEEREPGHVHTDECYLINQVLTCHKQELEPHTHDANCYDENGALICGKTEILVHQHTSECFVTPEGGQELTRVLVCGMEEHTHTEECYVKFTAKDEEVYYCGLQEHVHTMPDCYFESGELKCTLTEHVHDLSCLQPPVEESEEPEESQPPDESAAEGVELTNAEFTYTNDAFTMTFTVNGFARVADGQTDSALPQGSGSSGDPAPAPTAEALVEITNQMVPLAALPRMMSFTMPDESEPPSIIDEYEFNGTTAPGLVTEPGGTAVDNSSQPVLNDPVLPETEAQPAASQAVNPSGYQTASGEVEFSVMEISVGEAYDEVMEKMLSAVEEDELIAPIQVMEVTATMDGQPLDLTGCQITVEVQPSQMLAQAVSNAGISTMSMTDDDPEEEDNDPSISVTLCSADGQLVEQVVSVDAVNNNQAGSVAATYTASGRSMVYAASTTFVVNPEFTVQFYANLDVPESSTGTSGTTLPFIDTSSKGNAGTAQLPQNGNVNPPLISLGLNKDGTVVFNTEVTEIYKSETKEFNPKLGDDLDINYLNSLRDNGHYAVSELWVLIDGREPDSKDAEDWAVYKVTNNTAQVAFTNNPALENQEDENGRSYIVVNETTVIRLVYDPVSETDTFKSTFYDYDISEGPKTASKMETAHYGINSYFDTDGVPFAFGNSNMGTDFGEEIWAGNLLNKANNGLLKDGKTPSGTDKTYAGLTLGLVSGMITNEDGSMDVRFSDGIAGPSIGLFGGGPDTQKGKIRYGNWNLYFNREGDTFTLSSVTMSDDNTQNPVASGLEKFSHPGKYDGETINPTDGKPYTMIWTNNFWPLDAKWPNQDNILDPMFGGATRPTRTGSSVVPPSDDDKDHNSYFGMTYSIKFDLVEEYVGPLEYYFFGDDDMWVFLDGELVCDIGGVHSSVGEYVDLWDYISLAQNATGTDSRLEHDKGQHTLSVFYTERGASGSTCWMQFTVPQISQVYSVPYVPNQAGLTISKEIAGITAGKETEDFSFTLKLSGSYIYNNYDYVFYDSNGSIMDKKVNQGTSAAGAEVDQVSAGTYYFTLKGGERLEIIGLPIGTKYEIEEKYPTVGCITSVQVDNGGAEDKVLVTGTIVPSGTQVQMEDGQGNYVYEKPDGTEGTWPKADADAAPSDWKPVMVDAPEAVTVAYTNTFGYILPETGGASPQWYTMAGVPLTAAMFCLWYKKKNRGEGAANGA